LSHEITEYFYSILNGLEVAINSNLAIAFIGGLTGAFGGALGAQHIVERSRRREDLRKELRNTNSATMVSMSICNAALALKKQHVQPLYDQFKQDKEEIENFQQQHAEGRKPGNNEYRFLADFRIFPAPIVPIETLKDLAFSKISTVGRPLALVAVIEQSLEGLKGAIQKRDILIQNFSHGQIPKDQIHLYYFGMPLPTGNINQEFPDTLSAIISYLNDAIFFSSLLCTDLVAHGDEVKEIYSKKFKKDSQKVSTVDFSGPKEQGLFPPESDYSEWLNSFTKQKENVTQNNDA